MKHLLVKILLATLFVQLTAVAVAHAATKGRIMTNGKVTLSKNGQVVTTYTDQGPIDESALISCDGACMVKMQGIALNAVDQTRFALKDSAGALNLFVDSGKVYFMVTDLTRQFTFFSPAAYQVKTEGFIAPASTEAAVKGFIEVNEKGTEIGMDSGSMVVQTEEGTKTVAPGQTIVLAMADVPDAEKDASYDGSKKEEDDDEGAWLGWESLADNPQITALAGIGVIGAVGLGAALIWDNENDADTQVAPPPPPPEPPPPPPPASRNR